MGVDAQLPHKQVPLTGRLFFVAQHPKNPPAQRLLEIAYRRHRNGVNKLLVELRVSFVGWETICTHEQAVIQIYRVIKRLARRVVIDHGHVLSHGAGLERFPRHAERDFVYPCRLELLRQAWIKCVTTQPPPLR